MVGTTAQINAASAVVTSVNVAGACLSVSTELKSLGVVIDSRLTFDPHVRAVCKACNYHIWALRHIRHLLPLDTAQTLACSIVGSRLDYCNSVLFGVPKASIMKLQRTQNLLARVVMRQPKYSHARPLLRSLHWLPITQRIEYKLAVLTFNIRSKSTPEYLHCLLSDRATRSSMCLRSSCRPILAVRRTRTNIGARAFSIAAPTIWNGLPVDIQQSDSLYSFRKKLKTFLFSAAYVD